MSLLGGRGRGYLLSLARVLVLEWSGQAYVNCACYQLEQRKLLLVAEAQVTRQAVKWALDGTIMAGRGSC